MAKYRVIVEGTMHDNKSYRIGDIIEENDNSFMRSLVDQKKVVKI